MGTLWIGHIRTMQDENDTAEAIFVENGIIQMTGTEKEIRHRYNSEIVDVINVGKNTIYPGFVDSHLHILAYGLKLTRLDLSHVKSSEQMKDRLLERVHETPPGKWVFAEGWNENNFIDRKIFHRRELDTIAPHNPMMLTRICRHAVLANSLALAAAGIDENTLDPPGGVIVRDEKGVPTGLLLDQAQFLLDCAVPELSDDELDRICEIALDHLISLGCVGGHSEDLNSYGGFKRTFDTYQRVLNQTNRRFRLNLLVHHGVIDDMHEEGYHAGEEIGDIQFGAMKIFSDGAFGGRTALLRQPYNDAPETNGVAIHQPDDLKALVAKARNFNMPVAIHAIGDLATDYAVSAIEAYPPPSGLRDRLIHGQLVPVDLRHRIKQLPAIIDIQPLFVTSDFPWVMERLGESRMWDAYAWKTLIEDGLICAGGSDAPIEYASPLLGIHAAVTRVTGYNDQTAYYPGQKLSVFQAIELYTMGSAHAIGKENATGKIAPGYQADFTVLTKDLFAIQPEAFLSARVFMTVVDNQIVYKKDV
ncbi:hypothetical protein EV207_10126 [Scopulibacillus darangshiensis]|uniref:Amidohydrolase 3 domain-containing protein n=1 Tax=Scopulibacillus darangshiensis TaxID=442528 RepID=A0A4R2PCH3_9BACL|nr:amidohydrolase [Scopulibacillus darangshiensis]TCP32054.1 hypothetical protein EV207_10126 [Scopulibacillus darangshiensis]